MYTTWYTTASSCYTWYTTASSCYTTLGNPRSDGQLWATRGLTDNSGLPGPELSFLKNLTRARAVFPEELVPREEVLPEELVPREESY